jgi:tetratricopeptide (TPR) repeat protein
MIWNLTEELPPLTKEEVRQVFINTLDLLSGFSILFLQCSPAEANRLIPRVRQEFPKKNIEVLDLVEPVRNLYRLVEDRSDREDLNILFVRGLEKSLEDDIKPGHKGLGDYYNLNTVPPILSHLNQQRENFRDHFGSICFVFVLPRFAIRYFVRRAPDFYDWNSGVFKIEDLYDKSLLDSIRLSDPSTKSLAFTSSGQQFLEEGNNLLNAGRYEEAIASYDYAIAIKPYLYKAWHNRGISLAILGRYEEAIVSYDRAIAIQPDKFEVWHSRWISLANSGRYKEMIDSYERAICAVKNIRESQIQSLTERLTGYSIREKTKIRAETAEFLLIKCNELQIQIDQTTDDFMEDMEIKLEKVDSMSNPKLQEIRKVQLDRDIDGFMDLQKELLDKFHNIISEFDLTI